MGFGILNLEADVWALWGWAILTGRGVSGLIAGDSALVFGETGLMMSSYLVLQLTG